MAEEKKPEDGKKTDDKPKAPPAPDTTFQGMSMSQLDTYFHDKCGHVNRSLNENEKKVIDAMIKLAKETPSRGQIRHLENVQQWVPSGNEYDGKIAIAIDYIKNNTSWL